MGYQCQHLTETQHNELLKLLQKFEEMSDGTPGAWETYPACFELKEDAKTICSIPYTIPKIHEEILKNNFNV